MSDFTTQQCEDNSARALDIRTWWTDGKQYYATSLEKFIELHCPDVWAVHQEKVRTLEVPWEASVFKVIGNTVEYFKEDKE